MILLYAPGDEQLPLQLAEAELPSEQQIDWLFNKLTEQSRQGDGRVELNQELSKQGGFSEIQWRIINEFINNPDNEMINLELIKTSIQEFVRERLQVKIGNIFHMRRFVHADTCRREFIFDYFEEEFVHNRIPSCCDICGVNLSDYQATSHTLLREITEENWKDYLAKILINSELSK